MPHPKKVQEQLDMFKQAVGALMEQQDLDPETRAGKISSQIVTYKAAYIKSLNALLTDQEAARKASPFGSFFRSVIKKTEIDSAIANVEFLAKPALEKLAAEISAQSSSEPSKPSAQKAATSTATSGQAGEDPVMIAEAGQYDVIPGRPDSQAGKSKEPVPNFTEKHAGYIIAYLEKKFPEYIKKENCEFRDGNIFIHGQYPILEGDKLVDDNAAMEQGDEFHAFLRKQRVKGDATFSESSGVAHMDLTLENNALQRLYLKIAIIDLKATKFVSPASEADEYANKQLPPDPLPPTPDSQSARFDNSADLPSLPRVPLTSVAAASQAESVAQQNESVMKYLRENFRGYLKSVQYDSDNNQMILKGGVTSLYAKPKPSMGLHRLLEENRPKHDVGQRANKEFEQYDKLCDLIKKALPDFELPEKQNQTIELKQADIAKLNQYIQQQQPQLGAK